MNPRFIRVTRSGPVTTITLDRPAVLNAIHPPMHVELQAAFDAFAADPAQLVCVLTGSGERAFCAGSDLKEVAAAEASGAGQPPYPRSGYGGLAARFDLSKPVIAAVNGLALGGGFEIVLACDLVVAVEEARFGLPEPLVGAVALAGGLHRLARQIGLKPALGLILTGRQVDAAEARSLGIVNEVVARAGLAAAIERWVESILRCSPAAIRASKATVYRSLDEPSLAAALARQAGYPEYRAWRESADCIEGPAAFAQKRPPRWTT